MELPPKGFDVEDNGYLEPAEDGSGVEVKVNPESERLQLLEGFAPWDGKNITGAKLRSKRLVSAPPTIFQWLDRLRYRGHLDNISNNTLTGAVNAFGGETNKVKNQLMEASRGSAVARAYKAAGVPSVVIGDSNYGEGSSREHATMQPRHLGVVAVIVKSFARIHETNLKKQGMLGLTFSNEADYDKIRRRHL